MWTQVKAVLIGRSLMAKIDFKKELKQLYNPSAKEVTTIDVPAMNFLMIDGEGDPKTSQQYKEAVEALFSVSYAIKFMIKKGTGVDYGVMPLEGLWWVDDMTKFSTERRDEWKWTSMMMQPKYVTANHVNVAIENIRKKKNLPALSKLRFESFDEGAAAQILHIGPYSDEGPDIAKIHAFIRNSGHALRGKHHEIYLSDPRRTAVLRQPME
jgi:hypothetical protein